MPAAGDPPEAREAARALEGSLIRLLSAEGARVPDAIALWFGEPDSVTPGFIRDAASRALDAGETFYTPNLGLDALRQAIANYAQGHGRHADFEQVCVTASGVNAIMLACQALLDPGSRVVIAEPAWPNLVGIPRTLGAEVETLPLTLDAGGIWSLDLDRLLARLTPDTRMVILNTPSNPTGWMLSRAEQTAVLAHCRRWGIWILADDVYERLVFEGRVAASFLDLAEADDRVIGINSFSKSWAMTGWRLGWMVCPPSLLDTLGKLTEYNMSCAPGFVQQAGVAALAGGETHIASFVQRLRAGRDLVCDRLAAIPGISVPVPGGAMYSFFAVEGCRDSLALARSLLHRAKVGLAPGRAFGPSGEGCLRLCFASEPERLEEACARIAQGVSDFRSRGL